MMFYQNLCNGCQKCKEVCPYNFKKCDAAEIKFLEQTGFRRVILPRETSLEEMHKALLAVSVPSEV